MAKSWRRHLLVIGFYTLLTLYVIYPVLPTFAASLPGMGIAQSDAWQNTWNIWWTQRALFAGENPYTTTMILHPYGASLYIHPLNIVTTLLVLPVQLGFGAIAAYNAAVLLGFVLTGYGVYLLALRLIANHWIAWFAGAVVAFSPFHLIRLADGHLSWITIQWIPFFMLFLLDALETHRRRSILAAALFLIATTLTSWYLGLYAMVFTALLVVVRMPAVLRARAWQRELTTLLGIGAATFVGLAPVLLPTIAEYQASFQRGSAGWDRLIVAHSADLVDLVFPTTLHPVWGDAAHGWHHAMRHGIWGWQITPGFVVLLLALIGSATHWRATRNWVIIVVALYILALGPRLVVLGHNTGIPLPYELLSPIPGISTARRPNHLIVVMLPLIAVLAGYGLRFLSTQRPWGLVATPVMITLAAYELLVLPLPAMMFDMHPIYADLRNQPGAVLELPLGHRSAEPMKSQFIHERPTVGGYLSRTPDVPIFMQTVPWARALNEIEPYEPDIVPQPDDAAHQAMSYYDIRTIIIHLQHHSLLTGDAAALQMLLREMLPAQETYRDAEVVVYQVPPVTTPHPFIYLGTGWQQRESQDGRYWRWMDEQATVRMVNPTHAPLPVRLRLVVESYQHTRPLTLVLDTVPLETLPIRRAAQTLHIAFLLPPGEHTLTFESDAAPHPDGERSLSLSFMRIELVESGESAVQ